MITINNRNNVMLNFNYWFLSISRLSKISYIKITILFLILFDLIYFSISANNLNLDNIFYIAVSVYISVIFFVILSYSIQTYKLKQKTNKGNEKNPLKINYIQEGLLIGTAVFTTLCFILITLIGFLKLNYTNLLTKSAFYFINIVLSTIIVEYIIRYFLTSANIVFNRVVKAFFFALYVSMVAYFSNYINEIFLLILILFFLLFDYINNVISYNLIILLYDNKYSEQLNNMILNANLFLSSQIVKSDDLNALPIESFIDFVNEDIKNFLKKIEKEETSNILFTIRPVILYFYCLHLIISWKITNIRIFFQNI